MTTPTLLIPTTSTNDSAGTIVLDLAFFLFFGIIEWAKFCEKKSKKNHTQKKKILFSHVKL